MLGANAARGAGSVQRRRPSRSHPSSHHPRRSRHRCWGDYWRDTMTTYVDTAYIAQALGFERSYVTDRVVKREDFPAPALVLSQKSVKWKLEDFERWCKAQATRAAKRSGKRTRGS